MIEKYEECPHGKEWATQSAYDFQRCDCEEVKASPPTYSPEVTALVTAARKSLAVMRECGWQVAVCAEPAGDGVLQAAATECHDDLRAALAPFTEKETKE